MAISSNERACGWSAAGVTPSRNTCAVRILRYVVAEDCGRIINPLIVDGQVRGGVAQGVGAALLEEIVYDEAGQLLTGTLMDYLVPTASEVPAMEVRHRETPSPTTLGGFRGMGEGGTIGAPAAIANAVTDALAPLGIEVNELPVTPERLFRMLAKAGALSEPAGEATSRSATGSPGRSERWGAWGAISGPPIPE